MTKSVFTENYNMFLKLLVFARKQAGLTQKQVADKLRKNQSYISKYENGKQLPEVPILEKISDYFNVSTDYLLGKTDIRNLESKTINNINNDKDLEEEIERIITSKHVNFCGKPLEEEDIKFLRDSLKATLEYAKTIKNKK